MKTFSKWSIFFLEIRCYIGSWRYKSWKCRFGFHKYDINNCEIDGTYAKCECSPLCPVKRIDWNFLKLTLLQMNKKELVLKIIDNTRNQNILKHKLHKIIESNIIS